jgi:hypothetical protein
MTLFLFSSQLFKMNNLSGDLSAQKCQGLWSEFKLHVTSTKEVNLVIFTSVTQKVLLSDSLSLEVHQVSVKYLILLLILVPQSTMSNQIKHLKKTIR